MKVSLNRIKELVAIIQSVTLSAAAVIGGIWAIFTFGVLGEIDRSQAELTLLEQKIRQQAAIEIEITAERISSTEPKSRVLLAEVAVKNVGTRNARLEYAEKTPFAVRHVSFGQAGEIKYGDILRAGVPWTRDPEVKSRGSVVRVGTVQKYPFAVSLPGPGLYFLTFDAKVSSLEVEFGDAGLPDKTESFWEGRKYVFIE